MKRSILLFTFILLYGSAVAQQKYMGQWAVAICGGISSVKGYEGSILFEKFMNYNSSIVLSATYINSQYIASDKFNFNSQQYMIGCRYGYSFNLSRITSLTLGVGALLGYENPPVRTKENKVLRYKSKFNFGLDLSPQLEVALTKKLSLFAYPRVMYIINSNFENFIFTGGLGFKLYL